MQEFLSDVQVCHQRLNSAFDLLLIFLCSLIQTLTPPPNNALLANTDVRNFYQHYQSCENLHEVLQVTYAASCKEIKGSLIKIIIAVIPSHTRIKILFVTVGNVTHRLNLYYFSLVPRLLVAVKNKNSLVSTVCACA